MLKNLFCLCALTSLISFGAYAQDVKPTTDEATKKTTTEEVQPETKEDKLAGGCGCGKKKNEYRDAVLLAHDATKEAIDSEADQEETVEEAKVA